MSERVCPHWPSSHEGAHIYARSHPQCVRAHTQYTIHTVTHTTHTARVTLPPAFVICRHTQSHAVHTVHTPIQKHVRTTHISVLPPGPHPLQTCGALAHRPGVTCVGRAAVRALVGTEALVEAAQAGCTGKVCECVCVCVCVCMCMCRLCMISPEPTRCISHLHK